VWKCKAKTEDEVWDNLTKVKNLSVIELKKLFKIEKYVNRTSNDDRFVND
jgi:hypothetical protein